MKLISLDLKNFRQHLETHIDFTDGVSAIVGRNGCGKTTILEGIAWALYGAPAVRGNNDTIRSKASAGGARPSASILFRLDGSVYRVTRELDAAGRTGSATLEVDGKSIKKGMTEVSDSIAHLLGMDYKAFFTSFFTEQKKLEFLAGIEGARKRADAISRMLGYDRLTRARERANIDKNALGNRISGLELGLADPKELSLRKTEAAAALAKAVMAVAAAEKSLAESESELTRVKPIWELSVEKSKRHQELSHRLELDKAAVEQARKRVGVLRADRDEMEASRKELESLRPDLAKYEQASEEYAELKKLQEHEAPRRELTGQISGLDADIASLSGQAAKLAAAEEATLKLSAVLTEAEERLKAADLAIQQERESRIGQQKTIDAQLQSLSSQRDEALAKRGAMVEAGPDGKCPTCERPLQAEFDKVLANFDAQIEQLNAGIAELDAAKQALSGSAGVLTGMASDREKLTAEVARLRLEKTGADKIAAEYGAAARDLAAKTNALGLLKAKLDALPTGFDQARYVELQEIGKELRPVKDKFIQINTALAREPNVLEELAQNESTVAAKDAEIALAQKSLDELGFSEDQHASLKTEYETTSNTLNESRVLVEREKGSVGTAKAVLESVTRDQQAYDAIVEQLVDIRSERAHLETLTTAFDKLRSDLNDRIRPELEAVASEILSAITDGRYNVLEINEEYEAMIRDDGELKPVISGGEEDVVNLAMRLAVSQMIVERAGQEFSLLVLDEVFGSLDEGRRENVVSLLANLKNRFEQIILITHIESIHDTVDNCIWVEFDESTKTSRVLDKPECEDVDVERAEDSYWVLQAKLGQESGYIGTEASEQLLADMISRDES